MNKNKPLDQVCSIGANALNLTSKLVNKSEFNSSILERLMDFAGSVPDFRRSDKGNIRHRLDDIIILMIFGRACGYAARADIIEFCRHNINKFRKIKMFRNGIPSESTLCRVETESMTWLWQTGCRNLSRPSMPNCPALTVKER